MLEFKKVTLEDFEKGNGIVSKQQKEVFLNSLLCLWYGYA